MPHNKLSLDKGKISLIKLIGARLLEARELNKFQRHYAAKLIGVSIDELKKIETGIDVQFIPLSLIHKAAQNYDVSIDFLFGETEDWELCPEVRKERDFSAHLHSIFAEEQAKFAVKLVEQDNQIAILFGAVNATAPAIKAVYEAILRFWELNQNFDNMPGGALVISRLDHAEKAGHEAVCQMVRCGLLPVEALK